MEILNSWLLYVISYLILATAFTQFYKIATKTLTKAGALTVLLEFMAGIIILILCPFFEMKFPTDIRVYISLGFAIIFYAITDRLNTTVRKEIEASTFSILKQISTVFMIIAGILFFKEPFLWNKIVGALLIVFSNILIFYKKGKFKFDKYVLLGVLSNLSFSIAMFLDVSISDNFNLPIYVAITLIVPAILIFIFDRIKISEIKTEFKNGNKKAMIITSVTWGLSIFSQLRAYQLGKVTTVAPLCALTVILNVLVGYLFLKEKDSLWKKIIAAMLVIISVILIKI